MGPLTENVTLIPDVFLQPSLNPETTGKPGTQMRAVAPHAGVWGKSSLSRPPDWRTNVRCWDFPLLLCTRKPTEWQTDGVQNAGYQEGFQGGSQHGLLCRLRHCWRLALQRQQSSHHRLQCLQEPGPKASCDPHQSKKTSSHYARSSGLWAAGV